MKSRHSKKPVAIMHQRPERKGRRRRLKVIRAKLTELGNGYLNDSQLKAAGVIRQPMSLHDKDTLPRFFAPYNGKIDPPDAKVDPDEDEWITENFPNVDKLIFEDQAPGFQGFLQIFVEHGGLPQEDEFPVVPRYKDWGDFGFPDLIEVLGNPRWSLMTAWDFPHHKPHIKCMIVTEALPQECLLYDEIVIINEIIQQRLRTAITHRHVDAPVMMFSFIGSKVRVLEGNFNGKELVVRATKLYDLKDDNRRGYELSIFLKKWWLGDTTKRSTKISV